MKKIISLTLCLILCLSLFACNVEEKQTTESTTEIPQAAEPTTDTTHLTETTTETTQATEATTDTLPQGNKANVDEALLGFNEGISKTPARAYSFDSFYRFLAHISDKATPENSCIQHEKSKYGEEYEVFIDELTAKEHIEVPCFDGEMINFRVSIYSQSCSLIYWRKNMPFYVRYPHLEEYEDFSQELSASEILKLISPSAPNVHNYTEFENYKNAYEKDIKLFDRVVSALVLEATDDDKVVEFYYDSMWISIVMDNTVYNSDFLEHFSMQ